MSVITREDYCIPFKEALKLHRDGYDLEYIYEVLYYDIKENTLKTRTMGPYVSACMAKSIFNAAYNEIGLLAMDSWPIKNKSSSFPETYR